MKKPEKMKALRTDNARLSAEVARLPMRPHA